MTRLPTLTNTLIGVAIAITTWLMPASSWAQGTWQTTLLGRTLAGDAVSASSSEAVFLYDTDLNITWLRDASLYKSSSLGESGYMDWSTAKNWATGLTVGSFSDWRLPEITDTGEAGCVGFAFSGGECGYNPDTKNSEMAHLFYVALGNTAKYTASGTTQAGFGLTNTGDFQNFQNGLYWLNSEYPSEYALAWNFYTPQGSQGYTNMTNLQFAMAVRSGDVAAVPEPETWAMLLAGLGLLGAVARRNHHQKG